MSGLLLIGVLLLWLWAAVAIARILTSRLKPVWIKSLVTLLVVAVLIPLPVADEIVGRHQLKALCEQHGRKEANFANAKGLTLIGRIEDYKAVSGMLLETSQSMHTYLNPTSNIPIIKFIDYQVKGGWFIHALGISETNRPLTFDSSCSVPGDDSTQDWLDRYQIKVIFNR